MHHAIIFMVCGAVGPAELCNKLRKIKQFCCDDDDEFISAAVFVYTFKDKYGSHF